MGDTPQGPGGPRHRQRAGSGDLRAPARPRRAGRTPTTGSSGASRPSAARRKPTGKGVAHRRASRKSGGATQPRRGWIRRRALPFLGYCTSLSLTGFVGVLAVVVWFTQGMPDVRSLATADRRPAVTLVAADGSMIHRYGDLAGATVQVDDLPDSLIAAVLAIEDRRFYSHIGIDLRGVARAMVANVAAGRLVQGGSTITQQLAKNMFLTNERTLLRKVQEALLALWLEVNYTKDEILSAYLNRVFLGPGIYGMDAAARQYFGVPATAVNLRQSAILAGLLQAPSRYSPASNPELALRRSETVLNAMVDAGFLTAEAREDGTDVVPTPPRRPTSGSGDRYFADWISGQVPQFVGYDPVDLRVTTTLDAELQRRAEAIVADHLAGEGEQLGVGQAAVVVLRPDGAVAAMVGGRSYSGSQFNRATQAERQPGSAFKPFVYLTALAEGLHPDDMVQDGPVRYGNWQPRNFGGQYAGWITARQALARSANTVAVRLTEQIGVDGVIATARRLGITTDLRSDLSLALGTSEVTLMELTAAYAGILNHGTAVWPYGIDRIDTQAGDLAYIRQGSGAGSAIDPAVAWQITDMMEDVLTEGTGRAAALARPAAGKSGTSQDYRDAWFIGFTADYVVGVWVGNDDGTPMDGVTGGGLPARIWRDVMLAAHDGLPVHPLPEPRLLEVTPPLTLVDGRPAIGPATGAPLSLTGGQPPQSLDRDAFDQLMDTIAADP